MSPGSSHKFDPEPPSSETLHPRGRRSPQRPRALEKEETLKSFLEGYAKQRLLALQIHPGVDLPNITALQDSGSMSNLFETFKGHSAKCTLEIARNPNLVGRYFAQFLGSLSEFRKLPASSILDETPQEVLRVGLSVCVALAADHELSSGNATFLALPRTETAKRLRLTDDVIDAKVAETEGAWCARTNAISDLIEKYHQHRYDIDRQLKQLSASILSPEGFEELRARATNLEEREKAVRAQPHHRGPEYQALHADYKTNSTALNSAKRKREPHQKVIAKANAGDSVKLAIVEEIREAQAKVDSARAKLEAARASQRSEGEIEKLSRILSGAEASLRRRLGREVRFVRSLPTEEEVSVARTNLEKARGRD